MQKRMCLKRLDLVFSVEYPSRSKRGPYNDVDNLEDCHPIQSPIAKMKRVLPSCLFVHDHLLWFSIVPVLQRRTGSSMTRTHHRSSLWHASFVLWTGAFYDRNVVMLVHIPLDSSLNGLPCSSYRKLIRCVVPEQGADNIILPCCQSVPRRESKENSQLTFIQDTLLNRSQCRQIHELCCMGG